VFTARYKKIFAEDNLDFRILLILDNASSHALDYVSLSENVKIMYTPPTTPTIKPTGWGVTNALKSYYLSRILKSHYFKINAGKVLWSV
jgi:hypothetical protein